MTLSSPIVWLILYGSRPEPSIDSIWSSEELAEKRIERMKNSAIEKRGWVSGLDEFWTEPFTLNENGDFEKWI